MSKESVCQDDNDEEVATLVILRHGQSTWNAIPTFTGWCDCPLTDRGIAEAKSSGVLLRNRGYTHFDAVFTSNLTRAIVTCELALSGATATTNLTDTPSHSLPTIQRAWQLNERHYGALQGLQKDNSAVLQTYGNENLTKWRREFHASPPPMDELHKYYAPYPAPLTESLGECQKRVIRYWEETIMKTLVPGGKVLLTAHSNTLRALVSYLDEVPTERVHNLHIPNSVPCVYRFDKSGKVVSPMLDSAAGGSRGQWLFSPENHARLKGKIGGSGSFTRSLFEAWDTNGDGVLSIDEIEAGLRSFVGGEDVATSAIAGKILEEIDQDGNDTLDLEEFETHALLAYRKFMPGLME